MKTRHVLLLSLAPLAMAFTMPSCPGNEAMQQQLDAITAKNTELQRGLQTLQGQAKTLNDDSNQMKQVVNTLSETVLAQKTAIEKLEASVNDTNAQLSRLGARSSGGAKASGGAKKKHR